MSLDFAGQSGVISAIIVPLIALIGILITVYVNYRLQRQRLVFENKLADRRFDYDVKLAERKFDLDRSLNDWRRKSEFAEIALAEFYEARSLLRAIRSPASYSSESEGRVGREDESADLRAARDIYYPVLRRFRESAEFFNSMRARRYRASALFGTDAELPYNDIWRQVIRVDSAASELMRPQTHQEHHAAVAHRQQLETRIWEHYAEPDLIATGVDDAISAAEAIFQPVIIGRPRPESET